MILDNVLVYILIAAIVLILAEALLPGGLSLALGLSAMVAVGLTWLGLIESWPAFIVAWVLIAGALMLVIIPMGQRFFGGQSSASVLDDDLNALGTEVVVLEEVSPDSNRGKIRLHGSAWSARSKMGSIRAGGRVKLVQRDGLVWLVVPVESAPDASASHS